MGHARPWRSWRRACTRRGAYSRSSTRIAPLAGERCMGTPRQTGGCRTPQDCSPSRLPSTAIDIRQTLSDCREHNGIMERRLSDRVSGAASTQVSVCRRGAHLPMVGGYHNCGIRGTENNSSRYQPLRSCLSAIPHSLELPLTDMAFSIPKHWIALHTGAGVQYGEREALTVLSVVEIFRHAS